MSFGQRGWPDHAARRFLLCMRDTGASSGTVSGRGGEGMTSAAAHATTDPGTREESWFCQTLRTDNCDKDRTDQAGNRRSNHPGTPPAVRSEGPRIKHRTLGAPRAEARRSAITATQARSAPSHIVSQPTTRAASPAVPVGSSASAAAVIAAMPLMPLPWTPAVDAGRPPIRTTATAITAPITTRRNRGARGIEGRGTCPRYARSRWRRCVWWDRPAKGRRAGHGQRGTGAQVMLSADDTTAERTVPADRRPVGPSSGSKAPLPAWAPLVWWAGLAVVLTAVVVALVRPPGPRDQPDPARQRDGLRLDGPVVAACAEGVTFGGRPVVLLFDREPPDQQRLAPGSVMCRTG